MIVGAIFGANGGPDAGEAYVVFGKATGFGVPTGGRQVLDLTVLTPSDGFIIQGDSGLDQAGASVSAAGDVNGDGFGDLIVGAIGGDEGGANAGEAFVVFGKASGFGTIDLTTLTAAQGFVIIGDAGDDQAGFSVSAAGDVNGDGFDDMLVGAPFGNNGGTDAGEAYLVFGNEFGLRHRRRRKAGHRPCQPLVPRRVHHPGRCCRRPTWPERRRSRRCEQ